MEKGNSKNSQTEQSATPNDGDPPDLSRFAANIPADGRKSESARSPASCFAPHAAGLTHIVEPGTRGIPDGKKPPPIAFPYDKMEGDAFLTGLGAASRNVAVIRYRQSPFDMGSGFFITPHFILTAAHVAEIFTRDANPPIWVHYNDSAGFAKNRTFVDTVFMSKFWSPDGASETDMALIKVSIPHNNFHPTACGVVDIDDAVIPEEESPALKVSGKTGGRLKLLSFFNEYPRRGLAPNGLQITTGNYLDPSEYNVIPDHILGGHNCRSYKAWSGASVLQSDYNDESLQKVVGVHVNGADGINLFARFSGKMITSLNTLTKGQTPSADLWTKIWQSNL